MASRNRNKASLFKSNRRDHLDQSSNEYGTLLPALKFYDEIGLFKSKMKNLYDLRNTAQNEFERIIFDSMNKQFKEHEDDIIRLAQLGLIRVKH